MAKLTKQRGSKQLQARKRSGRYVRPVLDVDTCDHCKRITVPQYVAGVGRFAPPVRVAKVCGCQSKRGADE